MSITCNTSSEKIFQLAEAFGFTLHRLSMCEKQRLRLALCTITLNSTRPPMTLTQAFLDQASGIFETYPQLEGVCEILGDLDPKTTEKLIYSLTAQLIGAAN